MSEIDVLVKKKFILKSFKGKSATYLSKLFQQNVSSCVVRNYQSDKMKYFSAQLPRPIETVRVTQARGREL